MSIIKKTCIIMKKFKKIFKIIRLFFIDFMHKILKICCVKTKYLKKCNQNY